MDPDQTNPNPNSADFIIANQRGAIARAVGSLDDDPEQAARSVELSGATGVPAPVINADLENFERQHKATLTASLLNNNEYLQTFINSNPMAAKVANDDYANLDAVSQRVSGMGLGQRVKDVFHGMMQPPKGFAEGFGQGGLGSWISPEDWHNYPLAASTASVIGSPIEGALRTMSGVTRAVTEEIQDLTPDIQALGPEKYAGKGVSLSREVAGLAEAEAMGMTGRHAAPEPLQKAITAYTKIKPYIESGREPPHTVLPEYDDFRADQNAQDLDNLKEATSAAAASALRERSPALFKQFIEQHTDAEIGIGGDAAAKLYEGKEPQPEDNLLGWVPDIESKLALARDTGADVSIPLADWLTHAEPEVMQALHDDIRVRPNGITKNEDSIAKAQLAANPTEPLLGEVPQTRAAAALEPLLSVGDRKLELQRMVTKSVQQIAEEKGVDWNTLHPAAQEQWNTLYGNRFGPAQGFHDFNMVDEKGNTIGALNLSEQKGGKQLYVDNITGVNGLGPRDFGPSLMRDILRQIKEQFPNAESISGHRVSGARERAGKEMTMPEAVVKLDALDATSHDNFRQLLEGGQWETYSPNTKAYIKPDAARTPQQRDLVNIVNNELDRIAPHKVAIQAADAIKVDAKGIAGQRAGEDIKVGGTYIRYKDTYPIILYALDSENALGTARHEAIHHLRAYGFFNKDEWSTLENEALAGDWTRKYNIDRRYPTGSPSLKLEESIAEAYQDWAGRQDKLGERAAETAQVPSPLDAIFQKMKQFFDSIKERIGQLLGKDPTWEDVFKRVDTGEVGAREDTQPLDPRAFNEQLSVSEEPEGGSRVFERAAALGMTTDQFKRYDELIAQRHAEDIEAATKRATAEKTREYTKQWKDDRKALRVEVADDIRQRPDVAADLFFGAQELYGKKLEQKVKLNAEDLTPEQKATLPRDYYGADGVHPDDVANLFGYGSGDVLVERLGQYNAAKLAAGMSAKDFVNRVTDIETDRQMRVRHGVLEDNIMDAVKEQVTGETQQNILHEETVALGMKAGQAPLDKATVLQQLRDNFAKMPLGSVSSDAYLRAAGKAGRQAEISLLENDPANAFKAKQQQYYATVIANEAAKLQRDIAKFDKIAKRFSKREVASVDQAYTNFIHDILLRVGRPVRRSVQDLQGEIAAGEYKDLQSFVEGKNGFYLREVAVADQFFDPGFRKAFDDLTVDEFRATDTSIRSLLANGRDEKKITKAGAEADLDVVKAQMIDQLKQFAEKQYDAKGGRWMGPIPPRVAKVLRIYGTAHIQMENLFNRWDHDNPQGVFQQYIMRDLVDAANNESVMEKRYASRLRDIDDKADLKKGIDNTLFKVPGADQIMQLNRGNLRTILLNAGNASNLTKLAKGYKLDPAVVRAWIDRHATKEDWDWAQKMGDVFAELKGESDTMYRHLSGVAAESIRLDPIDTPHGQYPGWYYPLIAHPEFEGPVKKMMGKDALEQEGFVRATTANGYTKARTGATYPLALDLDMLAPRMKQMVHDIAMRPSVINASKIFYDKDVRSAIFTRFGAEWRDMMIPYLVDVANSANYMPKSQKVFANVSEFIRQNIISTLVGLNPGTMLKHGPTAAVQSLHEVGTADFLKALKGLTSINERTGETNWDFAMKTSEELQRRHQNYVETLGGATELLQPKSGYGSFRNTVQRFGATPVAISDLLSAVPTWLAQYEKTLSEGQTHGDSVYMADRAVRRAHGSVAITNRSGVMRGGPMAQWFASVYGFFNHIMNRQYELLWKSGDALGLVKDGQYGEAMSKVPELSSMLFAYVVAPALIEELITPLSNDQNESWGKKAAKGVAYTLGASWVGVRDFVSAMLGGRDPSIGLMTTGAKMVTDVARDLNKKAPFSKDHAGKVVRDGAALAGAMTGVVPGQVGKVAEFGLGVASGQERPKGPWGWATGMRFGTLQGHPGTFQEWQRHHTGGR